MSSDIRDRLCKLLLRESSDPLADRCLTALQAAGSDYHTPEGASPVSHLLRIYRIRAKHSENPIYTKMVNRLVSSLETSGYESVAIHAVELGNTVFGVFTN